MLYKSVTSICDCQSLQITLGNLNSWSKHNRIKFNTSKCKSLTVSRKKSPLVHEYTLDSAQLERVSSEKVHKFALLETPHPRHHCESQQARWAFKTNMPPNNRRDCSAHAIPVAGQVSAVVRHASLVARSSHPKGPSRASTTLRHPLDFTTSGGRGLLQGQINQARLAPFIL